MHEQRSPGLMVVGITGYLGARIAERARGVIPLRGTSSRDAGWIALDLLAADAFDYARLAAGDAVAVCAGLSAPDACARDRERARALNLEGTGRFIERALHAGARVIFLSSDTVYGECATDIDESAPCRPLGDYAEMKHAVECRFAAEPRFRSLRLSYVFSAGDGFTAHLRRCAERGIEAEVFRGFYRAVVHRDDVADAVVALARRWDCGLPRVINVGGPEVLSRGEYAQLLRELALPALRFREVEAGAGFFDNRPGAIHMRSPHLAALLERPARALREAIALEFHRG